MEIVAAFIVGVIVGTWVSRRKAVARAFAQGVESVTAQATATGGSVVFVGSADEYRTLAVGAAAGGIASADDSAADDDGTTVATYTGRRAIRLARGRVDRALDGTGRAVGAGRSNHDVGSVRAVNATPVELAAISAAIREPWRFDEADPRFDPHVADSIDVEDDD